MELSKIIAERAHSLFLRHGISGVTMDDIARDLGMSTKTAFKFFHNKDELLEGLVKIEIQNNKAACETRMDTSDNAIIKLFFLMMYAKQLYVKLDTAIIYDLKKHHHGIYALLNNYKNQFIYQSIITSIQTGIVEEVYQPDLKVEVIARFFLESLVIIADNQIFPAEQYPSNILEEQLFGHMIIGIATPVGMELINGYKNQRALVSLIEPDNRPYWDA